MDPILSKIKSYPITSIYFMLLMIIVVIVYSYSFIDRNRSLDNESKQDTSLNAALTHSLQDNSDKSVERVRKSMETLTAMKNDYYAEANDYYRYLYVFSVLLSFTSIAGSIVILLLVKSGWTEATPDVRLAVGVIFFIASLLYLMPKLMNEEQNYTANLGSYYQLKRQLVYSTQHLSSHYCCEPLNSRPSDMNKSLCAVADSNYATMRNNLDKHYGLNVSEAYSRFETFQKSMTTK